MTWTRFTFEVDFSAKIVVENVDDSFHQRILFQLRNRQKLADAHRSRSILKFNNNKNNNNYNYNNNNNNNHNNISNNLCTFKVHLWMEYFFMYYFIQSWMWDYKVFDKSNYFNTSPYSSSPIHGNWLYLKASDFLLQMLFISTNTFNWNFLVNNVF